MKKILFEENVDVAQKHIDNVKKNLLQPLKAIASEIENLGIGTPTKEILVDVLFNGYSKVQKLYEDAHPESKDSRLNSIFQERTNKDMARLIDRVENARSMSIYTGMKVSNPKITDYFDVDESGNPYLLESFVESIKEETRVYIKTPVGIRLCELQKEVVRIVQQIYNECKDIEESEDKDLPFEAKRAIHAMYPLGLFETVEDKDSGRLIFKASHINFDPEQID